jgi:hypothetical protein
MSWGVKIFLNELYAYQKLVGRMRAGDFLVKFDSDVIFLSDTIFQFVASSNAEAIGTAINYVHSLQHRQDDMQGGCYFILGKKLMEIVNLPIVRMVLALFKGPEDQFMSGLLRRCGTNIFIKEFVYHDPVLAKAGLDESQLEAQLRTIPRTTSVLHFEGDKCNMRRVAERLLPPLSSCSS